MTMPISAYDAQMYYISLMRAHRARKCAHGALTEHGRRDYYRRAREHIALARHHRKSFAFLIARGC